MTAGSVMAYFGSKDGLFREIVGGSTGITVDIVAAAADGPARLSHALANAYLERWDRTAGRTSLGRADPLGGHPRSER